MSLHDRDCSTPTDDFIARALTALRQTDRPETRDLWPRLQAIMSERSKDRGGHERRGWRLVPAWRLWLEGLVRAPLVGLMAAGLLVGIILGREAVHLPNSGAIAEMRVAQREDVLFGHSNLIETPGGTIGEEYFDSMLLAEQPGRTGP